MSSKDIVTPKSLVPVGTMIITTPTRREILGKGPSAFMDMWLKAVKAPEWEEKHFATTIEIHTTHKGYGKRGKNVVGSMRNKKHRRAIALHSIVTGKQTFEGCYPVSADEIKADSDSPIVLSAATFEFSPDFSEVSHVPPK